MITIEQIKEYIKCPQFGDIEYGKWGALKLEQREAYKHLIDIIEGQDKEIERLNNIIDKAREYIQDRYDGEVLTHTFDKDNVGELLNILKGVDKE